MNRNNLKFGRFLFICLFIGSLFSCDNFMQNENLREIISEEIALANAQECVLSVDQNSQAGYFLPAGTERRCRIGSSIPLKFITDKDWFIFEGIEAVSSIDNSVSRNDCVKITANLEETDSHNGEYVYNVKLLKGADDILLRPYGLEYPRLVSYSPASSSKLNYANTPIVLTFNIASDKNSLFNNMSIRSGETDLKSAFDFIYDSSARQLTLKPNSVFYAFLSSIQGASADVEVYLYDRISVNRISSGQTYNLSFVKTDFTVNYKNDVDNAAPVIYESFASRKEIRLSGAELFESADKLQAGTFDLSYDGFSPETVYRNRCNGTLYIYGSCYDEGSGIKVVSVSECLVNNVKAGEVEDDKREYFEKEYLLTENEADIEYTEGNDGTVRFCVKHQIKSQEDGAVLLNVSVKDVSGNKSAESVYTVIKKSFIDTRMGDVSMWNGGFDDSRENDHDPSYYLGKKYETEKTFEEKDTYNSLIKTLYFTAYISDWNFDADEAMLGLYGNYFLPRDSIKLKCEYINSSGEKVIQAFEPYRTDLSEDNGYWKLDLDVEKIAGLSFTLTAEDDFGNRCETQYSVPDNTGVTYTLDTASAGYAVNYISSHEVQPENALQFTLDSSGNSTAKYYPYMKSNGKPVITAGKNYRMAPRYGINGAFIFTEIIDGLEVKVPDSTQKPAAPSVIRGPEVYASYVREDGIGYLAIRLEVDHSVWDNYDAVYADFTYPYYTSSGLQNPTRRVYLKNGEYTLNSGSILTRDMFRSSSSCRVYGIKNNIESSARTFSIPKVTDLSLDNNGPELEWFIYPEEEYVDIIINDFESGVEETVLYINGKEYRFTNHLRLYYWQIIENNNEFLSFKGWSTDTTGNSSSYNNISGSTKITAEPVDSLVKSGSYWNVSYTTPGAINHSSSSNSNRYLRIDSMSTAGATWSLYNTLRQYPVKTHENSRYENNNTIIIDRTWTFKNVSLPVNSFVRFITGSANDSRSYPVYFYTGTKGSGNYDLLMANGSSKTSVAVSSDAPVFVHTLVTSKDYESCKNWTEYEWEFHKKSVGDTFLSFSSSNRNPQKYTIPVDEIESGECYCVIAHFSDGSTVMSDVMQR